MLKFGQNFRNGFKEEFLTGYPVEKLEQILRNSVQPETSDIKQDLVNKVRNNLNILTDRQRQVVELLLDGVDFKQISEIIGGARSLSNANFHTAVKRFKQVFGLSKLKVCRECGKEFLHLKQGVQYYCSKSCNQKSWIRRCKKDPVLMEKWRARNRRCYYLNKARRKNAESLQTCTV